MSFERILASPGQRLAFLLFAMALAASLVFAWSPAEAQQGGSPTGTVTETTTPGGGDDDDDDDDDNGTATVTQTGTPDGTGTPAAPTVADTGAGTIQTDSSGAPMIFLFAAGALVAAAGLGMFAASRRRS